MGNFFIVGILLAVVVAGPLITIWSLNHLFGLNIEYDLLSWFAVLWLSAVVYGPKKK